jgi:hypothetical protein
VASKSQRFDRASANIVEKAKSVGVIAVSRPIPRGWGTAPPFISQREDSLHSYMHAALFPYVWRYGEKYCGADGRPGESRSC